MALSDFLVKVKSGGAGDTLITLQNFINAIGGKNYNPYKFSVYLTAAANATSTPTRVPFDTKEFDTGSNVDVTTNKGRFTAPVAGFYQFNAGALFSVSADGQIFYISLYKNGVEFKRGAEVNTGQASGNIETTLNALVQANANDYFELFVVSAAGTTGLYVGSPSNAFNYFQGYLVSAT